MALSSEQARRAAAKRWGHRPIVVCATCGNRHRCVEKRKLNRKK